MSLIIRALNRVLECCCKGSNGGSQQSLLSPECIEMAEVAWEVLGSSDSLKVEVYNQIGPESLANSEKIVTCDFQVKPDYFEFLKVLGHGAYGKVFLGREKATSRLYAIKVLSKNKIIVHDQVEHTLTENQVLRSLDHPFLISLKYSFQTADHLFNVMEYACGGDLHFHKSRCDNFTEEMARFYGAEVAVALGYLHQKGVLYRDLKLENILVMRDGHVKLADFGLCKSDIWHGDTAYTFCGTPEYLAPEIIMNEGHGLSVDWWSFGIVMYAMLYDTLPFYHKDESRLYYMILQEDVSVPPLTSEESQDLVQRLLVKDPDARLGAGASDFEEIMEHKFFASISWTDLYDRKVEPPFKPDVSCDDDTRYFDQGFTDESVELPNTTSDDLEEVGDEEIGVQQEPFSDFSFQNDNF